MRRFMALLVLGSVTVLIGSCGADSGGVRSISADQAFEIVSQDQPDNIVVLDIRTPAEFDDQRLADATLIDFYEPDFVDRVTDLDRDVTYVMYCRSGNRSGQAMETMEELGFTDVREIDGGILSWLDKGHPFVTSAD